MALSNLQERIEVSFYERIRQILVREQLLPDVYDNTKDFSATDAGDANWQVALKEVITSKGFAVEPFGHSTPDAKGDKNVPRIVIIPRRFMPGDIGQPVNGQIIAHPDEPDGFQEIIRPQQATDFHIDIHLVSGSAKQDRILNAVMYEALPQRGFIPFYDTEKLFFLQQYNYYDLPDPREGTEEKVYSYEVKDCYLAGDIILEGAIAPISEITLEFKIPNQFSSNGNYNGFQDDGSIVIDLSHIQFKPNP